jgi:DNA-binding GntR family transcriptional regulator
MNNVPGNADVRPAVTLVETAYQRIRTEILCGKLTPDSKLRVEQLRERLGVGSSTIREALSRLVADALVIAVGQRGFRVAPISLTDLKNVSEVRKLLETHAIRESIEQGDDNWEAAVVATFHRLSKVEERIKDNAETRGDEWEELNRAFHQALMAGCKNTWLHYIHGILYNQSVRYRRLSLAEKVVPRDVHAEHRSIMDAALARNADLACRLTEDHIDRTLAVITTLADTAATKGASPDRDKPANLRGAVTFGHPYGGALDR